MVSRFKKYALFVLLATFCLFLQACKSGANLDPQIEAGDLNIVSPVNYPTSNGGALVAEDGTLYQYFQIHVESSFLTPKTLWFNDNGVEVPNFNCEVPANSFVLCMVPVTGTGKHIIDVKTVRTGGQEELVTTAFKWYPFSELDGWADKFSFGYGLVLGYIVMVLIIASAVAGFLMILFLIMASTLRAEFLLYLPAAGSFGFYGSLLAALVWVAVGTGVREGWIASTILLVAGVGVGYLHLIRGGELAQIIKLFKIGRQLSQDIVEDISEAVETAAEQAPKETPKEDVEATIKTAAPVSEQNSAAFEEIKVEDEVAEEENVARQRLRSILEDENKSLDPIVPTDLINMPTTR